MPFDETLQSVWRSSAVLLGCAECLSSSRLQRSPCAKSPSTSVTGTRPFATLLSTLSWRLITSAESKCTNSSARSLVSSLEYGCRRVGRFSNTNTLFSLLQLSEKDMSMLEERIKRSAKKPSAPAAPVNKLQPEEKTSGPANAGLPRSSEVAAAPPKLRCDGLLMLCCVFCCCCFFCSLKPA